MLNRRGKTFRVLLGLLGLLGATVIALALAACGGGGSRTPAASSPAAAAPPPAPADPFPEWVRQHLLGDIASDARMAISDFSCGKRYHWGSLQGVQCIETFNDGSHVKYAMQCEDVTREGIGINCSTFIN
jgi:hypothetical protein